MTFFLQLKLLIWKNYTHRKRQWGRLIIEIVWPLFLFMILFLVRLRGLKKNHHECYFEEKVMPSAGFLPFAQSFICTFNNTCHRSLWTEPGRLQSYNQSFVNRLVDDLEDTFIQNFDSKEKVGAFTRVVQDLDILRKLSEKIRTGTLKPGTEGFDILKISSLLKSPEDFFFDLNTFLDAKGVEISPAIIIQLAETDIRADSITEDQLNTLMINPKSIICDTNFTNSLINSTEDQENVNAALEGICNLTLSDWIELGNLLRENVDQDMVLVEVNNFIQSNVGGKLGFEDWKAFSQISDDIRKDLLLAGSFSKIFQDIQEVSSEFALNLSSDQNSAKNNTENSTVTDAFSTIATISRIVCGRNLSASTFSSGGAATRYDNLRDQIQEKDDFNYVYDNTTTKECNDLIESWERSRSVRFLWSQMKPFFRGKILFSPDTPATRKIVKKINSTFEPLEGIKQFINDWNKSYSKTMRKALLDPDNQEFLKELFTSEEEGNLLDMIFNVSQTSNITSENNQFNVTETRERLSVYFEGNFSDIWERSLDNLDKITQNASQYLDCFEMNKFEAVDNEKNLGKRGLELIGTNQLWAGLVFVDFEEGQKELPRYVTYKIRIDADKVDSTKRIEDRLSRRGPRRRPGIDLKYLYYGFAYLQDMVEHAIIAEHTGRDMSSLPGISVQQMPYPCYIEDRFIIAIARTFPLFMTLAWVYSASMIIKSIVHEKEVRLKETMRVMGLGNAVHWCSWFIDSFSVMFGSCILLTIILVYGNILENSSPSLVFCFMLTYTISTIMLAFFLSTIFSKANVAAAAGGIIFFMLYLPYSFMVVWEESLDPNAKIASCLISNIAFGFGCSYFSHFEETGIGAQWDNIWASPLIGDNFSMAGCMGMMLLDSVLYGILMWYIEAVFPGEFGVPKPWYFFLTKSYWMGRPTSSAHYDSDLDIQMGERPKQNEAEPTHLPLGVSVQHMHKVYPNGKVAVEDLNLNFYEGQITSFLGHNGAGKTTTISILTGLFPPSAGTAKINDLDIQKDMDQIRQSLGTCPQHNVLFDQLTVAEHLWFYARLKGQKSSDVRAQTDQMVQDLGLPHKRNEMSKNLSGGMQRKLSIASAFVGGSKVVVLDEPTAGVDPYSRRAIWDLLIKYKAGRTIILTTHFMDEADLLGDRIAIINCGKLVCCGSSLFLKSLYGVGYYLTLVKTSEDEENVDQSFDNIVQVESLNTLEAKGSDSIDTIDEIEDEGISDISTHETIINPSSGNDKFPVYPLTKFIQKYIPNARLVEEIGSDIVFILPIEGSKEHSMKLFENLFKDLDQNLKRLKISTYGLSDTTLEEIFLKVASNENDGEIMRGNAPDNGTVPSRVRSSLSTEFKNRNIFKKKKNIIDESDDSGLRQVKVFVDGNQRAYTEVPVGDDLDGKILTRQSNPNNPFEKASGRNLVMNHIFALEIKRFHHSKRNKKGFICEIILPAVFVCLAMIFTLILPALVEEPELEITPWMYPGKGGPNTVFFANDNKRSYWPRRYQDELLSKNGFGTKCLAKSSDTCDMNLHTDKFPAYPLNVTINDALNEDCSCEVGTQVCPAKGFYPTPPQIKIPSGDILIDMTSRNISQWLMKTRDDYYKQRYGGFEFGIKNPLGEINMTLVEEVFTRLDRATNLNKDRLDFIAKTLLFDAADNNLRGSDAFDNIRVWFNNKGWASSVAYMNAANNMVLRAAIQKTADEDFDIDWDEAEEKYDPSKYGIKLISHPMNYTETQLDKELIRQIGVSLLHAICVIFAMSFVPASFVVFHIEERISKVKHLHFVSGVKPQTYWTAAFLWDLTMYIFSAILCIFIFLMFDAKAYVSEQNLGPLVLLMLLYGWASVPLMYPASFVFSIPSSAFVTLACANLFIGIITTITTFVLENFDDEELKYIGSILREVFLVFPHYCLGRGLMDMATENSLNAVIGQFGLKSVRNRFQWDFLGKYMFCLFIQGVLFFGVTLMIQSKFWRATCRMSKEDSEQDGSDDVEDEDVKKERSRVLNSEIGTDVLQVKNLFKRYKKNAKQAVDHLTFGVQKAECFGLLGVNGAGKTTTFKMLTGDTEVTMGEAFVNGFSILSEMDQCRQSLGYCPQFDALDPLLTGREHLRLYARLRGLDEASAKKATEWGLKKLGLVAYSDRCAGTYSGGNKRKLSTAIALIGNPSIVFLDEPTSGMDPGARRFLWNSILEMIKGGQSVVLTSHSMEECEALCSRLGIMVNGQFKCLGSIQHLKNRFGSGYTLTIRCDEGKTIQVIETIKKLLPQAELKEEHHTQLQYQLPTSETKLPVVFRHMEDIRSLGVVEDYSLTQTTLDEVFVRFASEQTELLVDEKPKTLKSRVFNKLKISAPEP